MISHDHRRYVLTKWAALVLLLAFGALLGVLVVTQFTLAILLGVGILGLAAAAFALQHYAAVLKALLFLNIALISLSAYTFRLPGGYDLQLNRAPLLFMIPLGLVAFLLLPYRPLRFRFSRAFVWYGLFTLYALLSTLFLGDNPRTASSQLAALIFRGALFVWLPQIIVRRRHLQLAGNALIVSGLFVIAFAIFQYVAWFTKWGMEGYSFILPFGDALGTREARIPPSGRIGPLFRLTLPFGSSSHLAPCIAVLLLVAFGLWLYWSKQGGWRSVFLTGYCLLMLLLLLGTYSRGAWAGFAAGLLAMVMSDKGLLLKRRLWRILLVIVFLSAVILVALSPFTATILARLDLSQTQASDEAHLRLFSRAVRLFLSNPVVGVGWANYEARTGVLHAHNFYMTILAEGGVIGLTLWLLLCGAILLHGLRAVRISPPGSFLRYWNLGLLGAFVSLLVNNLFQVSAFFGFAWVLAGLIIASHYVSAGETRGETPAHRQGFAV